MIKGKRQRPRLFRESDLLIKSKYRTNMKGIPNPRLLSRSKSFLEVSLKVVARDRGI